MSRDVSRAMKDKKIKTNIILFFATTIVACLAMYAVSLMAIDEYTKLLTVISIVCGLFFVGLYFAIRVFYLSTK
ncbi:hypothetical protein CHH27_21750 [Labrenzia sp. VG12]|nr:hypothetical protein CHH27_21750 [Labrenzia sp. VG12]